MTGQPFLATVVANHLVAVEIAKGADLTDLDGSGWTWTDITDDVVFADDDDVVAINIGRADESSETQTALMTCKLDNRDGAYSDGGLSPNWPYIRRGTPVRVRVSTNNGSSWKLRFQGSMNGCTPQWDPETGRWATVELSASGPLRRLEQGTPFTESAIRAAMMRDSTVSSYWPCEDTPGARGVVAARNGELGYGSIYRYPVIMTGIPGEFGGYGGFAPSAPVITINPATGLYCNVKSVVSTSASTIRCILSGQGNMKPYDTINTDQYTGLINTGAIMLVSTPNGGSVKSYVIRTTGVTPSSDGMMVLRLQGYSSTAPNSGDSSVFSTGNVTMTNMDGSDCELGLILTQSGSTTTYRMYTRLLGSSDVQSISGTVSNSGSTAPSVSRVLIGPYKDMTGLAVGHIVVTNVGTWPITAAMREPYDGNSGESPTDRAVRLAADNNIHVDVLHTSLPGYFGVTDTMGTQYYDTLTSLLRECERTNQGFLFDGWGPGLTFITKNYRENAANSAATLVLDASSGQLMEPFAPVDDDQLTINNVTAARRAGVTETYADLTGPRGVNVIGDFPTSIDVNPETDDNVARYAEWRVWLGTQEGYRYPSVSFALDASTELIASWLLCTPQSRIDVTNITSVRRQHPDYPIKLLLEGWHEEIGLHTWRVTANTSRAEPWNVVRVAAATGSTGDAICHMDTDSSQLNASVSAGATSISVRTNSGPLWVTSSGDADSFPFDIDLAGVRVTVTAISGASSPQTFTVSALPRAFTGSSTPGAGAPIKVWRQAVLGL